MPSGDLSEIFDRALTLLVEVSLDATPLLAAAELVARQVRSPARRHLIRSAALLSLPVLAVAQLGAIPAFEEG